MSEKVNLRHLVALAAVVEDGSVTQASARLRRAPSAIARSVREVEAALGVALFERRANGMFANAFGDQAYLRARRIAAELEQARNAMLGYGVNAMAPIFSMRIGARHLQVLAKLRELGHMPSVAKSLGITQPAVSATLLQIEASLEIALFRRLAAGMAVTEAGELLLFRVRRVLSELRHLEADIAQMRGEAAGRVAFAALPSSRTLLLPEAMARLTAAYPHIQISVVDAPFEILFADLHSGEIDFILTGIGPEYMHADFRVEVIGRDGLAVVVRAGHPLARRSHVTLSDLVAFPWVLRDRGAPSRELLNSVFAQMGVDAPHVAVQAGDLGILRGLLVNSDMVSAVSPQHLSYEIEAGAIRVLDIDLRLSERDIGIVQHRDSRPSVLCGLLIEEIRRASHGRFTGASPARAVNPAAAGPVRGSA